METENNEDEFDLRKVKWRMLSLLDIKEFKIAADGTSKVATSLVNDTGGFLRLTSAGFTYDSLTIKVKLFQAAKAAVPATKAPDTSTPAAPKAPAKPGVTKTITCVKGGLSKKVTGAKPACPAGYKQK